MSQSPVPTIFSQHRRARRARRAALMRARASDAADWFLRELAEDVIERLSFIRHSPGSALVIGDDSELLCAYLRQHGCEPRIPDPAEVDEVHPIAGAPFDLVVSLGRLDTVNDLPGALLQIRRALAPGALMIASFAGAGSLPQLRRIMLAADGERPAPRIHPQVDSRAATALLERAGFARQVVDRRTLTASYAALPRLLADLREQALGNALAMPGPPLGKQAWHHAREAFAAQCSDDGRLIETFEVLTLTGWNS